MMKTIFLCILLLVNLSIFSYELSNRTRQMLVDTYISLMPPLFGSVLKDNRNIIMHSFEEGLVMLSGQYPVITDKTYSGLLNTIKSMEKELIKKIRSKPNFREISEVYGLLAAYSFYMSNPVSYLNIDNEHKKFISNEYLKLIDYNRDKIKIFFYGFYSNDGILDKNSMSDLSIKLLATFMKDAHTVYPYNYFDEKSIPFGIAQMHLNSAFSNTIIYWFNIWKESGGYIKDSPYYNISPAGPGYFITVIGL